MIETPVHPTARGAAPSQELEDIILKLLAKQTHDRPETAGDIARMLRAASHSLTPNVIASLDTATDAALPLAAQDVVDGIIEHSINDAKCEQIAQSVRQAITSSLCALPSLRVMADADDVPPGTSRNRTSSRGIVNISGTARRSSERLRVSLRITEPDGVLSWSQNIDGLVSDSFGIEDAVSQALFRQFTVRTTRATSANAGHRARGARLLRMRGIAHHARDFCECEASRTIRTNRNRPPAVRSTADQLVLDGCRAFSKSGPTGGAAAKSYMPESFAYLTRALALDPGNARALCALGNWYSVTAVTGIEPQEEGLQRGRELIFSALAADRQLGKCIVR